MCDSPLPYSWRRVPSFFSLLFSCASLLKLKTLSSSQTLSFNSLSQRLWKSPDMFNMLMKKVMASSWGYIVLLHQDASETHYTVLEISTMARNGWREQGYLQLSRQEHRSIKPMRAQKVYTEYTMSIVVWWLTLFLLQTVFKVIPSALLRHSSQSIQATTSAFRRSRKVQRHLYGWKTFSLADENASREEWAQQAGGGQRGKQLWALDPQGVNRYSCFGHLSLPWPRSSST